jgi:hypothetical protein
MRHLVTLEATAEHSNAVLLLRLALMLHEKRINPEVLNWASDGKTVKAWMIVVPQEPRVREFVAALQSTNGVSNVVASIEPEPAEPPQTSLEQDEPRATD